MKRVSDTAEHDGISKALGDFVFADILESVMYWLPVRRTTLDALSHACRSTRQHIARHRDFARSSFACQHGCHVRFCRQHLDGSQVAYSTIWRHREQLRGLESLHLFTEMIAEEIFSIVSECPLLQTLSMCSPNVEDKVVSAIGSLSHLEILVLAGCPSVTSVAPLSKCRLLKELHLSSTMIDNSGLAEIAGLPLERLFLNGCGNITSFTPLGRCQLLKELQLTSAKLDPPSVDAISTLSSLEELHMSYCTAANFAPLSQCRSLKQLFMRCTRIDNSGIAAIASLPCLESLDVGYCTFVTCFAPLSKCVSLKTLNVDFTCIDDSSLAALAALPGLKVLGVASCLTVSRKRRELAMAQGDDDDDDDDECSSGPEGVDSGELEEEEEDD